MNYKEFLNIITGSKRFRFDGTVLEIAEYYTGNTISLDLSRITEEMLEELIIESEECYDDED
jgi:hypothetical protein